MSPLLDVLATAGGSVVLAAFFVWLLIAAARQERDGTPDADRSRPQLRPTTVARTVGKGGYAHG